MLTNNTNRNNRQKFQVTKSTKIGNNEMQITIYRQKNY